MSIELVVAIYLVLISPALSFAITPHLRSYELMLFASATSFASVVVGTWILANLIPLNSKLILSPLSSSSHFWQASLSVSNSGWHMLILLIPWFVVSIVIIRLATGFYLLSKKTSDFKPADDLTKELVAQLAIRAYMKAPQLYVSDKKGIAFSTTDSIYISKHIIDSLPENKLKALLAHELMHIKRHDQISRWCFLILSSLSLLIPSFIIYKRYNLQIELDTDSQASELLGDKIILAETIIACAKMAIPRSYASNFNSLDSITERVTALVEPGIDNKKARLFKTLQLPSLIMITCMVLFTLTQALPVHNTHPVGNLNPEQVEQLADGEMIATLSRSFEHPETITVNLQPKDSLHSGYIFIGYRYCNHTCRRRLNKYLVF